MNNKNFENALSFFENGIYVAPNFSSNYYWASKIYCRTSNKLIGLIYGEIFMNIERLGPRVEEISELLYVIYKKSINTSSDSITTIDFSKNVLYGNLILLNDTLNNIAFNMLCKPILSQSVSCEKTIDMDAIDRIRINFLNDYFLKECFKGYPNFLFDYHYELLIYGHLEAYNHWILKKGSQDEFGNWYDKNRVKWDKFVDWFLRNFILIDNSHRFYSRQYK